MPLTYSHENYILKNERSKWQRWTVVSLIKTKIRTHWNFKYA